MSDPGLWLPPRQPNVRNAIGQRMAEAMMKPVSDEGRDELSDPQDILKEIKNNNQIIMQAGGEIERQQTRRQGRTEANCRLLEELYDVAQQEQWEVPCLFHVDEVYYLITKGTGSTVQVEIVEERTG